MLEIGKLCEGCQARYQTAWKSKYCGMVCWHVSYGQPKPRPTRHPGLAEPVQQFSNQLASRLDPQTPKGRANTAGMELLLQALAQQEESIREGGGAKAIEVQHGKNRLTARERLELLLDPGGILRIGPLCRFCHV